VSSWVLLGGDGRGEQGSGVMGAGGLPAAGGTPSVEHCPRTLCRAQRGGISCLLLPVCHRPGAVASSGRVLALTLRRDAKAAEPFHHRPALLPPPATGTPAIWTPLTRRRLSPGSAIGGESRKMNHSEEGHVSPARECEKNGRENVK